MEDGTISYYDKNADDFFENTKDVAFHELQDKFISFLKADAYILDYGCGSGRDTKYFLKKGFLVDATDGSSELCKIASKETGIKVKHELFQALSFQNRYDAVWACASILHVPYVELSNIFNKVYIALKDNGVFYTSFKYGNFEGYIGNRYFTYLTEKNLYALLKQTYPFKVLEVFITKDVRTGRDNEKWLNIILQK